ncbi:hypothetical protein Hanom_Chr17g01560561 [Helianthus anomalus]
MTRYDHYHDCPTLCLDYHARSKEMEGTVHRPTMYSSPGPVSYPSGQLGTTCVERRFVGGGFLFKFV